MKIATKILAVFLALTLVGCYSHPNPIARDASYGATLGTLPGLGLMCLSGVDDDDESNDDDGIFGLSLIVLAGGTVAGLAIGAVVGVVHWMYETATWTPPQEPQVQEPVQQVEYNVEPVESAPAQEYSEAPSAVREDAQEPVAEPVGAAPAQEQAPEEEYAPQAIEK